jgi:hypothetical protein
MNIFTLSMTTVFFLTCALVIADEKKPDDPKPDPAKAEAKKADDKNADLKKPDAKKDDTKKPDDKKPDDKKTADTKKIESKSEKNKKAEPADGMVPAGELIGIVRNAGSSKKGITLAVETYELRLQGRRIAPAKVTKDVDLRPADDMVVRMLNPPAKFENGKARRYTSKELRDLRGDPKLPGYSAELESVKADQIVKVQLVRKKDAPKAKTPPPVKEKSSNKDKDKDKDKDSEMDENMPQIKMIVILSDVKD